MENVNDNDGNLTHQPEVEKNDSEVEKNDLEMEKDDSIGKSNTEAPTPVQENTDIDDPMIVEDKMKDEIVKNKETSEDGKISEKKMATMGGDSNEVAKVEKEPNSSRKSDRKLENGSGMIFMCNSKTKKDCYRYKILGLPMSKKDTVSKVSKGMRLFLFDCDLKLMYGIYKATSEGGDNIEPKAFKSAYPSQVRFSIVQDCLPLAEEKFKAAIKDNYYSKNKFDCQLSPEQVKKLCKLFKSSSTKGSRAKRLRGGEARADVSHRSGKYTESERRGRGSRGMRFRERDWEEEAPRMYREDPRLYERGVYPATEVPMAHHRVPAPFPSVPPPLAQHQRPLVYAAPPPPMAYSTYDRPLAMDPYGAGYLDHGQRVEAGLESGRVDPYSSSLYREPPVHHGPAYPPAAEAHPRLYYRY